MELYKVPRYHRVKVLQGVRVPVGALEINKGDELNFHHVDGMYSYCKNDDGEVCHLLAWAEVEDLGPIIKNEENTNDN